MAAKTEVPEPVAPPGALDPAALLRSPDRYDVITSEPSNPWVAGVEMLFSREFLALAKDRLAPGGVFVTGCEGRRGSRSAPADRRVHTPHQSERCHPEPA